MGQEDTHPWPSEQDQPDIHRIKILGKIPRRSLDNPKKRTKIRNVGPPPWDPGGRDKGTDPVNGYH
jgi:hypothetical protein